MLYFGKDSDSLTDLRYLNYKRVYLQLQEWNTLMKSTLDPKVWGLKLGDASLVPVTTDEKPAPYELLSRDVEKPVEWKQCPCHSNRLTCVATCRSC